MLLVSSRSLHLRLLQDKATWLKIKQVSCPCASAPGCFLVTTKLTKQRKVAQGQTALASLHGYFWLLLGHYTRGSCKTRQCSKGSDNFGALAQVPSVASWSPPHLAEGRTTLVSLHACFCLLLGHCVWGSWKITKHCSNSNETGVLARALLVASRSPHSGFL